MVENKLVGNEIVYIKVKKDEIANIYNILDSAKVEYDGYYNDSQDIFAHEEAEAAISMQMEYLEKDIIIPKELESSIKEEIYNKLNDHNIEYGIYDHDYLSDVRNNAYKKFMTRE